MPYETQKRSSSKGKKNMDVKKETAPVKKSTKSNRL